MLKTLRAVKFLFTGPLILLMLFVINLMTSPGHWWVQWAALGIGIAWVVSLFRVLRAAIILGGLAALAAWLLNRNHAHVQDHAAGGAGAAAGLL
jgi:hypothetical protein